MAWYGTHIPLGSGPFCYSTKALPKTTGRSYPKKGKRETGQLDGLKLELEGKRVLLSLFFRRQKLYRVVEVEALWYYSRRPLHQIFETEHEQTHYCYYYTSTSIVLLLPKVRGSSCFQHRLSLFLRDTFAFPACNQKARGICHCKLTPLRD